VKTLLAYVIRLCISLLQSRINPS